VISALGTAGVNLYRAPSGSAATFAAGSLGRSSSRAVSGSVATATGGVVTAAGLTIQVYELTMVFRRAEAFDAVVRRGFPFAAATVRRKES
jgi:hypothetical protein